MPCVASIESSNTDAMSVCTVCYLDPVTDKTFEHVAISLHMEYLLQEYKSLSDAWKLFQGINIYRTYLGVTAIPYQSEKAPKTCSLCLVKIIELAKASYIITQTYKNGYEQKEQTARLENSFQEKSPKEKNSKERWSTCASKKVATVHPNSSTTQNQLGPARQNDQSSESPQSCRNLVKTARLSQRSTSPSSGPCPRTSPPQNVSPPTPLIAPSPQLSSAQNVTSTVEEPIKQHQSRLIVQQTVTATQSQRPRRSRGRSLLERNPDFLVTISSANDLVSKIKHSVPHEGIKLSKTTVSGTNLEFSSMSNWSKSSKTKSPRKSLATYSDSSSYEKCSKTSPLTKGPQISSVDRNAQSSANKKYYQDSSLGEHYISSKSDKVCYDELPQPSNSDSNGTWPTYPQVRTPSNPTKRSRSISEESSPRPKRSGGRSLMDRNPDFHMDTTAFKTSRRTNTAHSVATVSTSGSATISTSVGQHLSSPTSKAAATVSSLLESPSKRRRSHKILESSINRKKSYIQQRSQSEEMLSKWKTSQFRSKHLNLLDKALSSVGWGQKHRNAKNMEEEVFQNAQSEEAYISKISRLVVYFSNGNQPLNSPSASSLSSIIGVQNTSEGKFSTEAKDNMKSKMEIQSGPNQGKRTRGKMRQLRAGYDNFIGTEPILEVIPIQKKKMDKIVQNVEEVATGKGGFIEPSKESTHKMDKKKSVIKSIRVGTGQVSCNICGKQFARRSLKNHIVKAHKDKKFLSCNICRKNFPEKSQYQYVLKTGKNGKQGRRYYQIQPVAVNEDVAELDLGYQKTKTRKGTSPRTLSVKKASLPEKAVVSPSKIQQTNELISDSEDMSQNESNINFEEGEDGDEKNIKCGEDVLLKSSVEKKSAVEKCPKKFTEEEAEEKKNLGKSWWDINQETEFE